MRKDCWNAENAVGVKLLAPVVDEADAASVTVQTYTIAIVVVDLMVDHITSKYAALVITSLMGIEHEHLETMNLFKIFFSLAS